MTGQNQVETTLYVNQGGIPACQVGVQVRFYTVSKLMDPVEPINLTIGGLPDQCHTRRWCSIYLSTSIQCILLNIIELVVYSGLAFWAKRYIAA